MALFTLHYIENSYVYPHTGRARVVIFYRKRFRHPLLKITVSNGRENKIFINEFHFGVAYETLGIELMRGTYLFAFHYAII